MKQRVAMEEHLENKLVEGPMRSGKSSALLQQARILKHEGIKYGVYKPYNHTRDGEYVRCRGLSNAVNEIPCKPIHNTQEIINDALERGLDAVIIDEVQFFDVIESAESVIKMKKELNENLISCYFYGLDTMAQPDMSKNPPKPKEWKTTKLLSESDNVDVVLAKQGWCEVCGETAMFTAAERQEPTSSNVVVRSEQEEGEIYQTVCGTHWREKMLSKKPNQISK